MFKVNRLLARALKRHGAEDHKLRIQRVSFKSDDLEVYCVFCGVPLCAGSPGVINEVAESLVGRGVSVYKLNIAHSSIRVH